MPCSKVVEGGTIDVFNPDKVQHNFVAARQRCEAPEKPNWINPGIVLCVHDGSRFIDSPAAFGLVSSRVAHIRSGTAVQKGKLYARTGWTFCFQDSAGIPLLPARNRCCLADKSYVRNGGRPK